MNKGVRIAEIELLRVVAAVAVLLYHMSILPGGYLAVEYFAVLSGLLMARGVKLKPGAGMRNVAQDTGIYIFKKIKVFYPELLVATCLGLLSFNYAKHSVNYSLQYIFHSITGNLFLLKMTDGAWALSSTVPPAWYLSSMVISMLLIYPFLCRIKKYFFFILGSLLMSYMVFNVGGVGSKYVDKWLTFAYIGNIRICSEFLIAIGLSPLTGILEKLMTGRQYVFQVLNAVRYACLAVLLLLYFYEQTITDVAFLVLALIYLIITFACADASKINDASCYARRARYCSMVSIAIFLSHSPALCISGGIAKRLSVSGSVNIFLNLLVTAAFVLLTIYGAKKIRLFFGHCVKKVA